MDMWLVWVAIFSVSALAGPLPQIRDVPQQERAPEALDQQEIGLEGQLEGFQNTPNFPSNGFSRNNHRFQFQGPFGQNGGNPSFSGVNQNNNPGGFFPGHSGGSSIDVVRVVHPSITDGVGSFEELGITTADGRNNFGRQGAGDLGISNADFGVGTSNLGNNAFGSSAFNPVAFGNQNFGHGGFQSPVVNNPAFHGQGSPFIGNPGFSGQRSPFIANSGFNGHVSPLNVNTGFNGQSFQARTGFAGQNFVPNNNNFANNGFHSNSFGTGFNSVPFSPGPPIGGNFPHISPGNGQFGPGSFIPGGLGNPGFIQNSQPQSTRVIVHSVPVVVRVINETHGSVVPHDQVQQQSFGHNLNTGGLSQGQGNKFKTGGASQTGSDRINNSPGTQGFSQGLGRNTPRAGSINQNSGSNLVTGTGLKSNLNENKVTLGAPVSIVKTEQKVETSSSLQTDTLPSARALISTSNLENPSQLASRAGFAVIENTSPNFIQTNEPTKVIQSVDTSLSTSSKKAVLPASVSLVHSLPQLGVIGHTQALDQISSKNVLPIPEALASFAAIGTPPVVRASPTANTIKTITTNQEFPSTTATFAATTVPPIITTHRPRSKSFGIIETTPVPSFSKSILSKQSKTSSLNTKLQTNNPSLQSAITSSITQLQVVPMTNINGVTTKISQDLISRRTGSSTRQVMRIGDPVSILPSIIRAKVAPLEQTKFSQSPSLTQQTRPQEQVQTATLQSGFLNVLGDSTSLSPSQTSGGFTPTHIGTTQVTGGLTSSSSTSGSATANANFNAHLSTSQISSGTISSTQSATPQISRVSTIPRTATEFPAASISQPTFGTNIPDANAQLPKITESIPVGSHVLANIRASTPTPISPSTIGTLNNVALSLNLSPSITTTPSPSFDIIIPNQQQSSTNVHASSNVNIHNINGVSTTNKGTSGIVSAAHQETLTPQAIIIIDRSAERPITQIQNTDFPSAITSSQVSEFFKNSAQQSGFLGSSGIQSGTTSSPVSLLGSFTKRLGEVVTGTVETTTQQFTNIQDSVSATESPSIQSKNSIITVGNTVLSSQTSLGNGGIQVKSLGNSGSEGSVTTDFFITNTDRATSPQLISSTQEVQGSNGIILGQSAVVPPHSLNSAIARPTSDSFVDQPSTSIGSFSNSFSLTAGQKAISSTSDSSSVQGLSASNRSGAFHSAVGQQSTSIGPGDSNLSTGQQDSTDKGMSTLVGQSGEISSSTTKEQSSSSSSVSSSASSSVSTTSPAGGSSASRVSPLVGKHALENSDIAPFSTKQLVQSSAISATNSKNVNDRGQSTITGSNQNSGITDIVNNPNVVLAIPLSLFSQLGGNSFGSRNNANSVNQGTGVATQTSELFNNFSFTTDPREVLKLVNQVQSSVLSTASPKNNAFGTSTGTNGNIRSSTSQSLQASSLTSRAGQAFQGTGTNRQQHVAPEAIGVQSSTATNIHQDHFQGTRTQIGQHAIPQATGLQSLAAPSTQQPTITIKHEPKIPGRPNVVSVASPSGSLTLLPDTLASLSKALGFGIALPFSPGSTLAGKQGTGAVKATTTQKSQTNSKLGNILKRESPHLS